MYFSQIGVAWLPVSGASGYRVYRDGALIGGATYGGGTYVHFTITGLQCGTGLDVAVSAVDAFGAESPKATHRMYTAACSGFVPPPPNNIRVESVSPTSVTIAWDPVVDAADYIIRSEGPPPTFEAAYWQTRMTFTGVPCGVATTFKVWSRVQAPGSAAYVSQNPAAVDVTPPCP